MSYRVRVLPSGAEFDAEAGDSLLVAGLRAGVNLRYRCETGTCGQCIARRVSGETEQTAPHDFYIPDRHDTQDLLLMCRHAARSDLELEAQLLDDPAIIPVQKITTQIRKIEAPEPDLRIVHLRTPRSQTLQFLAGQKVTLKWQGLERIAALGSCPCRGMELEVHLRDRGDDFSKGVFEHWARGSEILIEGPSGHFVLEEDTPHALTFLAWDTDFAPIRSLIEHAIAIDHPKPIRLVWATAGEMPYMNNLARSWVDALEDFTYLPLHVAPEAGAHKPSFSALARAWHQNLGSLEQADLYIAGPVEASQFLLELVNKSGDDPARIFRLRSVPR
ncbi:MAG: 2Fe-2S iron-sulfur cluster-binding protein [Gammaproteobacteria bacterium]|jgi:CDP-4-dehydro-6-deoxyglucose reductase